MREESISFVRSLTSREIKNLKEPIVLIAGIKDDRERIGVFVPYEMFMAMQKVCLSQKGGTV
jgi:hypothetical protein